jgi:P pilus assembly chaperone PapD
MAQNKILSTGVLAPDSQLEAAQVDVVNIDPTLSQTVTVEVFDWGVDLVSSNPTPVVVNPPQSRHDRSSLSSIFHCTSHCVYSHSTSAFLRNSCHYS